MRLIALLATLSLLGGASQAKDVALLEVWTGLEGDSVADLRAAPSFSTAPSELRLLDNLAYSDLGSSYGGRLTSLIMPAVSGDYRFFLASDDGGELLLSSDTTPNNLHKIAWVDGYTDPEVYAAQASQASVPLALVAGQRYLLQALHKQGGGGNHLSIAWQPPGATGPQTIPTSVLSAPELSSAQQTALAESTKLAAERAAGRAEVLRFMEDGEPLPLEVAERYAVSGEGPPPNDTGVNVLVDQSHQTQFVVLWGLRGELRSAGYRACSSVASLDSVVKPGEPVKVRVPVDELEPFAWWRVPEFNVVITGQQDLKAQPYTEAEIEALAQFVQQGGGLLVFTGRPPDQAAADAWSLNGMLKRFGARVSVDTLDSGGLKVAALDLGPGWEVLAEAGADRPVRARRAVGLGRVLLVESQAVLNPSDSDGPDATAGKRALLRDSLAWLAAGKPPAGGSGRLASTGGVGIYPELAKRAGNVVVLYAANQPPEVRALIDRDFERAAAQVPAWLPTRFEAEPYVIVLCGGGGGGWAINPRPKAAAVIEYEPLSILGVFGHEMAHTMTGPANDRGQICGHIPIGNQGEAHAGWFQGKLDALFSGNRTQANRNCNSYREAEAKAGRQLDLATEYETAAGRKVFGYGTQWTKMWYIWQKLDDRFGPTWYPRWYWVRSERWKDDPNHRETWDEMVETMSIAVGEDLFPFFRALGTSGLRERCPVSIFNGQRLDLPVSPLDTEPAGHVRLEPIGDYRQPLKPLN